MISRPLLKLRQSAHLDRTLRTAPTRLVAALPERFNSASPSAAHHLFEESSKRSLVQDDRLLPLRSKNDVNKESLNLFFAVLRSGGPVDDSTLSRALGACGPLSDGTLGRQLHCLCVKGGYEGEVGTDASLVEMCGKCGGVDDGRRVFEWMSERNVASWTSLLNGYVHNGLHESVLDVYFQMRLEGIRPNPFVLASIIAAAAAQRALRLGRRMHAHLIKFGHQFSVIACNSLINMYSKCGAMRETRVAFRQMVIRDAVSWNTMIAGLVLNGHDIEALETFYLMRLSGLRPTQLSFLTVIKLCANLKQLFFGRQLHCCLVKNGFDHDTNVITALMVVYNKCNELGDAFALFSALKGAQNVVSWTAIISGYIQNGDISRALVLFNEMRKADVKPNEYTYSILLAASSHASPFHVHAQIIKTNHQHVPSVGTALLVAYTKHGSTHDALSAFVDISGKDVVTWSAMLSCYAQAGDSEGAVRLFTNMAKQGVAPNEFTLSSAIDACAIPKASADQGKQFHALSIKLRYQDALCVSSALVTMYARRGSIESAHGIFKRQSVRDLVSWNSMLSGYAQHGYGKKALEIFREMEDRGIKMDGITFIGVITACTHVGLVEEGRKYFTSMVKDHGISPTMEHYACMVDLYSRAGKVEEAFSLIKKTPFPATATIWRTFLGACRVHKNIRLGEIAAENLLLLEPTHSAAYVLLSNIYAAAGKWDERAKIRKLMDDRKVKKEAGCSWIQVKNKVHSFLASDRSHPLSDQIYSKLEDMMVQLKEKGYRPDTEFVLHDMEEEHKEAMLARHSERLAIAFGLIVTSPGTPLQIMKNLRVCGDCHTVFKLISELEEREIVVRDSSRFHHFSRGSCSCGDYW